MIAAGLPMLCSCANTTYFKEPGKEQPHGVLAFSVEESASGSLFRVPQVVPLEINGSPPNHWTKMNMKRFNVASGDLDLRLQAPLASHRVAICSLGFKVEPDHVYSIEATNSDETTRIRVLDAENHEIATCESKREFAPQNKTVPLILAVPVSL